VPRSSVYATDNEYLAGIRLQYIAGAQRISDLAVVGAAVRYMDIGAIDGTDINGTASGQFHPRNYVSEVGWGQSIVDLTDSEGGTSRWASSSATSSPT